MNPTDLVDQLGLRADVPDFAPGDTLRVHVRVVEGNPELRVARPTVFHHSSHSDRSGICAGQTSIERAAND